LTPKLYKTLAKRFSNNKKEKRNLKLSFRIRGKVEFKCFKCGFPFQIGNIIVSKTIRGGRKRYYHKECYDSMFYDVADDELEEFETEIMVKTPQPLISNN